MTPSARFERIAMSTTTRPYLVLRPEDHVVLGEGDFGMPGLRAAEAIGPFVQIQASGPLITVHDSVVEARLGIGHHPTASTSGSSTSRRGSSTTTTPSTASPATWTPGTWGSSPRAAGG